MKTKVLANKTALSHAELEAIVLPDPKDDAFAEIGALPLASGSIWMVAKVHPSCATYGVSGPYVDGDQEYCREDRAYVEVL